MLWLAERRDSDNFPSRPSLIIITLCHSGWGTIRCSFFFLSAEEKRWLPHYGQTFIQKPRDASTPFRLETFSLFFFLPTVQMASLLEAFSSVEGRVDGVKAQVGSSRPCNSCQRQRERVLDLILVAAIAPSSLQEMLRVGVVSKGSQGRRTTVFSKHRSRHTDRFNCSPLANPKRQSDCWQRDLECIPQCTG